MMRSLAILVLPLALLAGCKGEKKEQGAGTASGQVLPGSASDAMLPLDTVRSQAPLAPRAEGSGKTKDEADAAAADASDAPADPADAAEPSEEPAPAEQ